MLYQSVIWMRRPCSHCDGGEHEAGPYDRMDCGCQIEYVTGEHTSKKSAISEAKRFAKSHVSPCEDGSPFVATGDWHIETEEDGTVLVSELSR